MNKITMTNMISWLMDNPSKNNGKAAYYLTKVRHEYYEEET